MTRLNKISIWLDSQICQKWLNATKLARATCKVMQSFSQKHAWQILFKSHVVTIINESQKSSKCCYQCQHDDDKKPDASLLFWNNVHSVLWTLEGDVRAYNPNKSNWMNRVKLQQLRPTTDSFPAPCSTLARRHWPDPVPAVRPGVQVSAQHGSWIPGRPLPTCLQHRQPQTSPVCKSWSTAGSTDQEVNLWKPCFRTCQSIYLFIQTFLTFNTLYLLLDAIWNIFTSRSTRTPSTFDVITVNVL